MGTITTAASIASAPDIATTAPQKPTTTTITLFTRHTEECNYRNNPQWKRCNCRKSLYIYENGKVHYKSARTRSWDQAERVAQTERDARDPVKIELAKIAAEQTAKQAASNEPLADCLDQWLKGRKNIGSTTKAAYQGFKRFVLKWAGEQGISAIGEVTADHLDKWVASWTRSTNTQGQNLTLLRSFFRWASTLRKIDDNPASALPSIRRENEEETKPLTPKQFDELLQATYRYDADRRRDMDKFGVDMRAVFMLQRWTGLRLSDALMLPRSGVHGNRIVTTIQKSKGEKPVKKIIDRLVPDAVITALNAVPVRKRMHPDQFFWSRKCDHRTLACMWTPRVRLLNKYLSFVDDDGKPINFHSHMLRDTFAVELLLSGMPLEKVSKLLTHESIRVTEKHYAPWVKDREKQLESEMIEAMQRMGATFSK